MAYLKKTIDAINTKTLEQRKKRGQYFTPSEEVYGIVNWLDIKKESLVLEPSFGTGEFLEQLLELSDNVYGVELDKDLFTQYNKNCFNEDFLTWETDKKFDFIIGNPPYFETSDYNNLDYYKSILSGRTNIYSLFIKKSIDLLKDDGVLVFIIPTTINTGSYFSGIRNYIAHFCSILSIEKMDFPDVDQEVQILTIKKNYGKSNKYIFNRNGKIFFSKRYRMLNYLCENFNSIQDLGFTVRTGSIVWNTNKEYLCNEGATTLIWNENIRDEISLNKKTGQYINKEPQYPYGIVFKRIISSENYCFVDFPFLAENHVNVIYHPDREKLLELFDILKKSKIKKYLKYFTESTQLSKTELQELPLWESMKEIGPTSQR